MMMSLGRFAGTDQMHEIGSAEGERRGELSPLELPLSVPCIGPLPFGLPA